MPPTKTVPQSPSSKKRSAPPVSISERIRKPSAKLSTIAATIYGRSGVGKTTLLGTMPGKGLVIDVPQIEGGTMVLEDKADKIDVLQVVKWEELDDVEKFIEKGDHDYDWIAFDTITALQVLAMRKVVKEHDIGEEPTVISMRDWGKIGQLNAEFYFRFRRLRIHIIFLAQEQLREGGEDGVMEYKPTVSPVSLTALIPSMMVVGRLYTREVVRGEKTVTERRLRVGASDRAEAKIRTIKSRPVPDVIKNPHLGRLFAYLLGKTETPPDAAEDEDNILVSI